MSEPIHQTVYESAVEIRDAINKQTEQIELMTEVLRDVARLLRKAYAPEENPHD